jgi:hypothetical protein
MADNYSTQDEEQYMSAESVYTEPLTDWPNEPTCSDLKKDLEEATPHHDAHVTQVNEWLDNLNVTGSARISKVKGRSTIVPKLIRKQAEWRYAALSEAFLSHENIFETSPVSFEDKKAAIQNGLILNQQFNTQMNKVSFIDEYVRTAVDEGTVVVRVGWKFEEEVKEVPIEQLVPVQDPQVVQTMIGAAELLQSNPASEGELPADLVRSVKASAEAGLPVQYVTTGFEEQPVTVVNQPTLDVCDYNNVIIDPTCKGDIKKANFVIYRFETNMSDLEKAGIYTNLDKIIIDKSAIEHEAQYGQEDTGSFNFTDKPRRKFIAYEYWGYWDIEDTGQTQPFVATWVGETLIRMERSPFPDEGLPFVAVQYLPKRKNVYGDPDGALLEDNQKIAGAVTRGMLDIMGRSAAGQTGIRKDALDVTNRRKFDAGMDYQFNAHVNPVESVYHHVYPEIPQSAQFVLQLQNMEAEALTGVKAFHQGITGEGLGRSATAARSAIDAAGKRELGILRRLGQGVIEIGRKIMAMNAEFLSEEEVVRVTNEDFITVKRDDLAGRVDIKLQISTAETDAAKAEELAFMLQTMGNNMDANMSKMILSDIARLRKMPELAKAIQTYEPTPDPMEEKLKELQLAELDAKIRKLNSEAAENLAEAELDRAKARESEAKADQMDLTFVEQESGVTHARNLQQDQAQGEMNLKRDLVKEALKSGNGAGNSTTS